MASPSASVDMAMNGHPAFEATLALTRTVMTRVWAAGNRIRPYEVARYSVSMSGPPVGLLIIARAQASLQYDGEASLSIRTRRAF